LPQTLCWSPSRIRKTLHIPFFGLWISTYTGRRRISKTRPRRAFAPRSVDKHDIAVAGDIAEDAHGLEHDASLRFNSALYKQESRQNKPARIDWPMGARAPIIRGIACLDGAEIQERFQLP
jgi:hypothetical protein